MLKTILRIGTGGIFVLSGFAKWTGLSYFIGILQQYTWLPSGWIYPLAVTIPSLELLFGLLLITGYYIRPVSMLLIGLVILFTSVGFIHWLQGGSGTDCGCFGPLIHRQTGAWLFVENIGLMGMQWYIIQVHRKTEDQLPI